MGLLAKASVAIDGSKFKVVNNRDRNFTRGKIDLRRAQLEESVARYLSQLDTADRQEPSDVLVLKTTRLKEKLDKLKEEMSELAAYEKQLLASPDGQISLTDPDSRSMATSGCGSGIVGYNVQVAVDTVNHLIVTHAVTKSGLSVDPTTEDDRCHYDAATAPRPRKTVADPIGIAVRVGGPYLPLDYCVGAACLAEISASAG